jgi:HTH-type transcriptional regulator/antitoxin HigA
VITNEKQLRSTRALVDRMRLSLDSIADTGGVHPLFVAAQRDALSSQIREMEGDIDLYLNLQAGRISTFEASSLNDLPDLLIQARIARGMSQRDLAEFLGMKEQQVQRYEAERYRSASLERLGEVADALNVGISERAELLGGGDVTSVEWTHFPVAEMFKRGWFEDFSGSLSDARKSATQLLQDFFGAAHAGWSPAAMHRKSIRSSGQIHEPALAAWEARVLTLADRNPPERKFVASLASDDWVQGLVNLSAEPDGPRRVPAYLRTIGIVLIVEPHLPGTLLDGAALRTSSRTGVVAVTLRHDRLDNFWFTLLHEIGHLKLHINERGYSAIFDDIDSSSESNVEEEADLFAQEALIPSSVWSTCLSRFTRTERAVLSDAKKLGISPAIIAGRIRRESRDYTILRNLVGSGEPRRQLFR